MALYEDILGAIDQYKPKEQQSDTPHEISLKITPQQPSLASAAGSVGGQTMGSSGSAGSVAPGASSLTGGRLPSLDMAGPLGFGEAGASVATQQQRTAPRNPQLPGIPQSPYIDDQFTAEVAMLRNEATKRYLQLQRQLGWADDAGNFIPGTIETEAARRRYDLGYTRDLAEEATTGDVQRRGAVFSGRHSDLIARARHPFDVDLARLESAVPQQLADVYDQMMQTLTDVNLQQNVALAMAAARAAEAARLRPVGSDGTGGGEGGETTPPAPSYQYPAGSRYVEAGQAPGVLQGMSGVHVQSGTQAGTHLTDADNEGGVPYTSPMTPQQAGQTLGFASDILPKNPTVGQIFVAPNGAKMQWNGYGWVGLR